jgi:uncharacterized protein (DUF1778 family)
MTLSLLCSETLVMRLTHRRQARPAAAAAGAQRSGNESGLESATGITSETLANRQSFQLVWEQWETLMVALDGPPRCIHNWQLGA